VLRPRLRVHVKKPGGHYEHPRGQVDGVEWVIEDDRLAGTHRQDAGHEQRNAEGNKVRWFACELGIDIDREIETHRSSKTLTEYRANRLAYRSRYGIAGQGIETRT